MNGEIPTPPATNTKGLRGWSGSTRLPAGDSIRTFVSFDSRRVVLKPLPECRNTTRTTLVSDDGEVMENKREGPFASGAISRGSRIWAYCPALKV